jgi:hypothetical protein
MDGEFVSYHSSSKGSRDTHTLQRNVILPSPSRNSLHVNKHTVLVYIVMLTQNAMSSNNKNNIERGRGQLRKLRCVYHPGSSSFGVITIKLSCHIYDKIKYTI